MCPFWDILFRFESLRGTSTTEKYCTLSVIWFTVECLSYTYRKKDRVPETCCALKATHFSSTRTNIKDKNIWIINWWWKLTIGSSFWLWNTLKVLLFLRNESFTSQNGDLNDCLAFVFPGCKHRAYVMSMNSWIIGDFLKYKSNVDKGLK